MGNARTAINMVGECAFLGDCTDIIKNRAFPQDFDFMMYQSQTGVMGAYSNLNGQASQLVILCKIFFKCLFIIVKNKP